MRNINESEQDEGVPNSLNRGKSSKRHAAEKAGKMTRKKIDNLIIAGSLALSVPMYFIGENTDLFSRDEIVDMSKLRSAEKTTEIFTPLDQNFMDEANKKAKTDLERQRATRKISEKIDPVTKNYLEEGLEKESIEEPLVKRKIGKLQIAVIGKKSVVDRFEAAWKVLEKNNIIFERTSSDFRSNIKQSEICENQEEGLLCAPIAGSYHLLGQAIDVPQVGMKKTNIEGEKIADVLAEFGFQWGFNGTRKMNLMDKGLNIFSSGRNAAIEFARDRISAKEALRRVEKNYDREDLVHFQMSRSQLKKAKSIEEATLNAESILKRGKK